MSVVIYKWTIDQKTRRSMRRFLLVFWNGAKDAPGTIIYRMHCFFSVTITRQVAVVPFWIVAVITAIPGDFATILRAAFTLATFGSEEENTGTSVVILGRSVIRTFLLVFGAIRSFWRLNCMLEALGFTVTLQVRVVELLLKNRNPFSRIFTVIVALPTVLPVHRQLVSSSSGSMETTSLELLLKMTFSSVIPFTVRRKLSPSSRSEVIIFNE